jgi:hypothetical protein
LSKTGEADPRKGVGFSMATKRYKHTDNIELRKLIEPALVGALQLVLSSNLTHKILSSNIMHTELQPDGDLFTLNFVVETHEKKEKPELPAP